MGNVWEWVEDHFNGMPGFETNMYYDDFSTPCFDGKHNLIKVKILFLFFGSLQKFAKQQKYNKNYFVKSKYEKR